MKLPKKHTKGKYVKMKTSRNFKILVLALSLVLIIGAVFMISASADEALSVSITKKNLSYGDVVKLLFAVDDTNAGDNEVEVLYYLDDPQSNPDAKTYTGVAYEKGYTEGDVTYPAFFTAAFPAKDIGAQIYAQAHIVGTDVYSEIVRYSVVEYLNKRLYVDDITDNQKGLYKSLLTYGAYAQKVLLNEDEDPYNDVTQFVDEMVYVSIEGGTLDGKYSTGVYYPGDKITPYAEGAVMWNVEFTDADGNTGFDATRNSAYYTVAGRSFISLNTNAALPSYFDKYFPTAPISNPKGWNFDDVYTSTSAMDAANKIRRATWNTSYRDADYDAIAQGTNEYIKIRPLADSNYVFEFGTGLGAREGFFFRRHTYASADAAAKNFVFEANLKLNISDEAAEAVLAAGDNYVMSIYFSKSSINKCESTIRSDYYTGAELGRVYVAKDEEGKFHYYFNYVNENASSVTTAVAELKNGWNSITIETTLDNTKTNCAIKAYVNGCKVGESSFDGTTDKALNATGDQGVRFRYNSAVTKSYIYLDNVYCSYATPFN